MLLSDKVAIVTGGTRGIGEAIVREFSQAGANVAFSYLQSNDKADRLVEILRDENRDVLAFKNDIRDFSAVKKMVEDVKDAFGRIDIIVNNAGILRDGALMMMRDEDWDDVITTNLNGAYNLTRAAIVTLLKQRSGNIINMSSVTGLRGASRQVNYAASKAGIIGMTKALAREVGAYNIRVNAIAPGYTDTDMVAGLKEDVREKLRMKIPLQRFGEGKEIAELALFLASEKASYITGQVIAIDGGLAI